ncbi:hypothetical protein Pla52n_69730 [Stieleria varia]|uniref:Uncharacterized protein n=1 Tax=Stieleria varia TaxID=2528005 RepID=A0A5C5ZL62_9BACT|nr:hypothetical protein Pla52n_69730 [Stieleria varia]
MFVGNRSVSSDNWPAFVGRAPQEEIPHEDFRCARPYPLAAWFRGTHLGTFSSVGLREADRVLHWTTYQNCQGKQKRFKTGDESEATIKKRREM